MCTDFYQRSETVVIYGDRPPRDLHGWSRTWATSACLRSLRQRTCKPWCHPTEPGEATAQRHRRSWKHKNSKNAVTDPGTAQYYDDITYDDVVVVPYILACMQWCNFLRKNSYTRQYWQYATTVAQQNLHLARVCMALDRTFKLYLLSVERIRSVRVLPDVLKKLSRRGSTRVWIQLWQNVRGYCADDVIHGATVFGRNIRSPLRCSRLLICRHLQCKRSFARQFWNKTIIEIRVEKISEVQIMPVANWEPEISPLIELGLRDNEEQILPAVELHRHHSVGLRRQSLLWDRSPKCPSRTAPEHPGAIQDNFLIYVCEFLSIKLNKIKDVVQFHTFNPYLDLRSPARKQLGTLIKQWSGETD